MIDESASNPQNPPPRRAALVGLGIVLALLVGGLVLVHVLRGMSRIQDCVMSGRTNCAPVDPAGS